MSAKRKLKRILSSISLIIILTAPMAQGSIIYDESISGDLPGIGEPEFTLAAGTNSILGSACAGAASTTCPDSDSFSFLIEPASFLDGIQFRFYDQGLDPRNEQLGIGFWLIDVDAPAPITVLQSKLFRIAEQDFQKGYETTLPLGPGRYRLSTFLTGPFFAFDTVNEWSYELQLQVSPVPVPSSAFLVLIACVAAMGTRKLLHPI